MNVKYESQVQLTKLKVLKEVAREAWKNTLLENLMNIPARVVPGPKPQARCCIYKERAIVADRVKLAIGGDRNNPNVIEVIELACDECPVGGYVVTDICRGCLAHKCEEACRMHAISFGEDGRAVIDKSKCVDCGMCAKACPYMAIYDRKRPCENACKIKAISRGENGAAHIDNNLCVSCGACSAQCPFGAIVDKSYILNVIDYIRKSKNNTEYNVHCIVAPAIASQFQPAKIDQIHAAILKLGFADVYEAAIGADSVALKESRELVERGEAMTSSCCPAFVTYIRKQFPTIVNKISHNVSPMIETSRAIKAKDPNSKVIFVGPCTAKKMEAQWEENKGVVDAVMTFEELNALFESKDIDVTKIEGVPLTDATYYGRIFAKSGGLSEAAVYALGEQNIDFEVKPVICNGLDQCKMALTKLSKDALDGNFLEGMACTFGCVGGAGNLIRNERNAISVDNFAKVNTDKKMKDTIKKLDK